MQDYIAHRNQQQEGNNQRGQADEQNLENIANPPELPANRDNPGEIVEIQVDGLEADV